MTTHYTFAFTEAVSRLGSSMVSMGVNINPAIWMISSDEAGLGIKFRWTLENMACGSCVEGGCHVHHAFPIKGIGVSVAEASTQTKDESQPAVMEHQLTCSLVQPQKPDLSRKVPYHRGDSDHVATVSSTTPDKSSSRSGEPPSQTGITSLTRTSKKRLTPGNALDSKKPKTDKGVEATKENKSTAAVEDNGSASKYHNKGNGGKTTKEYRSTVADEHGPNSKKFKTDNGGEMVTKETRRSVEDKVPGSRRPLKNRRGKKVKESRTAVGAVSSGANTTKEAVSIRATTAEELAMKVKKLQTEVGAKTVSAYAATAYLLESFPQSEKMPWAKLQKALPLLLTPTDAMDLGKTKLYVYLGRKVNGTDVQRISAFEPAVTVKEILRRIYDKLSLQDSEFIDPTLVGIVQLNGVHFRLHPLAPIGRIVVHYNIQIPVKITVILWEKGKEIVHVEDWG